MQFSLFDHLKNNFAIGKLDMFYEIIDRCISKYSVGHDPPDILIPTDPYKIRRTTLLMKLIKKIVDRRILGLLYCEWNSRENQRSD